MSMSKFDEVMCVSEVAEFLKLDPVTIRLYAREQRIPARKMGNQWRFLKQSLVRWMEEGYSSSERKPAVVASTSENNQCHYSKELMSTGSISGTVDVEYEKALGLSS